MARTAAPCGAESIVTTRGNRVEHWGTTEELAELLAPIDSLDEATMLAKNRRLEPYCEFGHHMRALPDGYEFLAHYTGNDELSGPEREYLVRVLRSGEMFETLLHADDW